MKVKSSKRAIEQVFVKSCDHNIQETLQLADRMIALANRGDQDREDAGCGIMYGILRDSAYKLKKVAEKEKKAHIRKGLWKKKDDVTIWRCINCGYLHEGTEAVEQCPACAHPQAYFEMLKENY